MNEDDKSEHVKTVYAHFGLAMYLAQCLEHGLVNGFLFLELMPHRGKTIRTLSAWEKAVDAFYDQKFEQTLGRLVKDLRKAASVPDRGEELLGRALAKRNWLAHHYFRQRAEDFLSHSGRERMIAELQEVQVLFRDADAEFENVMRPLRERYGLTDAQVAAEVQKLKQRNSNS